MGSNVVTVEHLGTFACRPIVGAGTATELSQHASANAIDIAGFRLRPMARRQRSRVIGTATTRKRASSTMCMTARARFFRWC